MVAWHLFAQAMASPAAPRCFPAPGDKTIVNNLLNSYFTPTRLTQLQHFFRSYLDHKSSIEIGTGSPLGDWAINAACPDKAVLEDVFILMTYTATKI